MSSFLKSMIPLVSIVVSGVVGCSGRRTIPLERTKPRVRTEPRVRTKPRVRTEPRVPLKPTPRHISWGFGEPCIRVAGGTRARLSGGNKSLRAQHVVQVDRVSPQWLVRARKHLAQSGGCVACARIGLTWKPPTVGFHAHLRSNGALLIEGRPAPIAALPTAVQSCFNMLDSAGMHVLLTTAPSQRLSARLTAVLKRLLIPGVSVHLYSNRP